MSPLGSPDFILWNHQEMPYFVKHLIRRLIEHTEEACASSAVETVLKVHKKT